MIVPCLFHKSFPAFPETLRYTLYPVSVFLFVRVGRELRISGTGYGHGILPASTPINL
jgi:hypothetical protein